MNNTDLKRFISLFVLMFVFTSPVHASETRPNVTSQSRVIDVSSVTWKDSLKTAATVSSVGRKIAAEVGPLWKRFTSVEGSTQDRSITFSLGQTLELPIQLNRPMECEGSAASEFMLSVRAETYKRLGISDYSKRYLVILAPESGCIWSGRALVGSIFRGGGVLTLHNTDSSFVIVHELGHTLGLGHSNFLRCDSGKNDGAWDGDCKAVEYGGTIDVMGNVEVDSPLSTYNQWILGYLDESEVKQSWITEKIELNASDVAGGKRVIFLRDNKSTYWVEYRRPNFTSSYKAGLVFYRTDPPPRSSIVSPNPEDALGVEPGLGVTTDYWMLNWDDYTYVRSRASGSMTLPNGSIATTFSGNISIIATPTDSDRRVMVSVTRKADKTPPPAPEITDPSQWRYPNVSIIKSGYDDGETAIAGFEIEVDGNVVPVESAEAENFSPTYLNPFTAQKTVYLKNLPEGNYSIAIRAIDAWGNRSQWSKSVKAYVDRGNPIVTSDLRVISINANETQVKWVGLRDEGIGLCSTVLHNPEGFVLARSSAKSSPVFTVPTAETSSNQAQVFDCLGNGIAGEISMASSFIEASNSKRTGKWSTAPSLYGMGALKCTGKCSASMTVRSNVSALIGEGSAELIMSGKPTIEVAKSSTQSMRISEVMNVGTRNRVIRIVGSNFVFGGVVKFESKVGAFRPTSRSPDFPDPSLSEPVQKSMSRLGFNQEDFTSDWTVLPMARGTTLLDPTLDLCSSSYVSESGREIRRQISVTKDGMPYTFLSSESVKYKSVAAANSALAELKRNVEVCIANKGFNENGIFTSYAFQPLPSSNKGLVDEKSRVAIRVTIDTGARARQLLGFYQYSGQYFTGLYIVLPGEMVLSDAEATRWLDVAGVMANRLQAVSSSSN